PHHPRTEARVVELLDERGYGGFVAVRGEGVADHVPERQDLDPLRGPVRLDLGGWYAPHLFGVGLEELPIKAPSERPGRPALEGVELAGRVHTYPQEREAAPDRLEHPETAQRISQTDRVVVESPFVINPAEPAPEQEVPRSEDLAPQVLDLGHLGEEAVPPDVEPPSLPFHGTGDPAHDVVHLKDRARGAPFGQLVS